MTNLSNFFRGYIKNLVIFLFFDPNEMDNLVQIFVTQYHTGYSRVKSKLFIGKFIWFRKTIRMH